MLSGIKASLAKNSAHKAAVVTYNNKSSVEEKSL